MIICQVSHHDYVNPYGQELPLKFPVGIEDQH
jgi:hypothetical protein